MASKPATLEVVPPAKAENLTALASEINETHAVAKSHAQLAVVFALRTGVLCQRAKKAIEHGAFGAWLEKHCPQVSDRTAQRYMALVDAAKNSAPQLTTGKNESDSLLPEGELIAPEFLERVEKDPKYRDRITSTVREVVGEGSLSELYKDYGITRGPANVDQETGKRIHYPATKAKKLSPEQLAKQNRAAAKAQVISALGNLKVVLDDKGVRRWLEPKDWVELQKLGRDRMKQLDAIADKAAAALAKGGK
jgi:hypothetical protein